MSTWGTDHDAPWLAGRPEPLDPVEALLLAIDWQYRHPAEDHVRGWQIVAIYLAVLLAAVAGLLAAWAGGSWLVARAIEAVTR